MHLTDEGRARPQDVETLRASPSFRPSCARPKMWLARPNHMPNIAAQAIMASIDCTYA